MRSLANMAPDKTEALNSKISFVGCFGASVSPLGCQMEHAAVLMKTLSKQLASVSLPTIHLTKSVQQVRMISRFNPVSSSGCVELTFRDDEANQLQEALDLLINEGTSNVSVLICKVNEQRVVLEAFYLERLKLQELRYSKISYGADLIKTLVALPTVMQRASYKDSYPTVDELIKLVSI